MAKRNPEICPYCGHVILDDNQEYCDYCGMDIEKEEAPDRKSSGSCLGVIMTAFFVFLLVFIFIVLRP